VQLLNVAAAIPGVGTSHVLGVLIERRRASRATLRLHAAGDVSGRVLDAIDAPVESVRVAILAEETPCRTSFFADWMDAWSFGATSDRDGRFHFEGLLPGKYSFTTWHRSSMHVLCDARPGTLVVEAGKTNLVELQVAHDATLTGQVLAPDGRPPLGLKLYYSFGCCGDCDEPRADGSFEFPLRSVLYSPMPHSGPPRLERSHAFWVASWNPHATPPMTSGRLAGVYRLDLGAPIPADVTIPLQATGRLIFDVWDRTANRPAVSIRPSFYFPHTVDSSNTQRLWGQRLDLPCDSEIRFLGGKHSIAGVPAGTYEILVAHVWASVGGDRAITVAPGAIVELDRIDLDAKPIRTLAVRLHGIDPATRISLRLDYSSAGDSGRQAYAGLHIKGDGTFHVTIDGTGRCRGIARVSCWGDGCFDLPAATVSEIFEFDASDSASAIDVRMIRGSRFRIAVMDQFETPGMGWMVRIAPVDSTVPIPPQTLAVTMGGHVQSWPLPAGRYSIDVLEPGATVPAVSEIATLRVDQDIQDIHVALPGTRDPRPVRP
jgi:hypothetical protein